MEYKKKKGDTGIQKEKERRNKKTRRMRSIKKNEA